MIEFNKPGSQIVRLTFMCFNQQFQTCRNKTLGRGTSSCCPWSTALQPLHNIYKGWFIHLEKQLAAQKTNLNATNNLAGVDLILQCGKLEECVPACVSIRVSANLGEAAEGLWKKIFTVNMHTHLVTGLSQWKKRHAISLFKMKVHTISY